MNLHRRRSVLNYSLAIGASACAVAARFLLTLIGITGMSVAPATPAVIASTLFGGRGPGLLCTAILAVVTLTWPASGGFHPPSSLLLVETGISTGLNLVVLTLCDTVHRGRKRAMDQSLTSARLAAIVESSDDAIISKTLTGRIESWNGGAVRLFGYTAEEAVGRQLDMLVPPERSDEEQTILAKLRAGEHVDHFETVRVRKDGTRIEVSVSSSPVRNNLGQIVAASKIARNIGDRRRLEAQRDKLLLSAQEARQLAENASRLKDEFLGTLSHELRTPINAILGYAQLLRHSAGNQADVIEAAEVIERNSRAQVRIIAGLLDMSRIISGNLRLEIAHVQLGEVLHAAVQTMGPAAQAKNIEIVEEYYPVVTPLDADGARLQQVAWNLLSNAIKFTPADGSVRIETKALAHEVRIIVSDTGQGIQSDFLPYVFDRFRQADSSTTRRHGGLGLGLSIVKNIVELYGGSVAVLSEGLNRGTTMTVRLPTAARHARPRSPQRPVESVHAAGRRQDALKGIRVLVVDDERDSRELVRRVLEASGASVTLAESAVDAIARLDQDAHDVLLSDIGMPDQDGYELIRTVRRRSIDRGGAIPAAAVTAFARSDDQRRALTTGFQAHVSKPLDANALVSTVAELAGRQRIGSVSPAAGLN